LNFVPLEISAELVGDVTGGTGRFEGATGSFVVEAEVFPVGETQSAFTGTTKGIVEIPD
jgi:hypothetical protein